MCDCEQRVHPGIRCGSSRGCECHPKDVVPTFQEELEHLINKHSLENGSNTPDFILAEFLANVLVMWNLAVCKRDEWGRNA